MWDNGKYSCCWKIILYSIFINMVKRCKDCPWNETRHEEIINEPINEEVKIPQKVEEKNENEWLKRFSFPKYWVQVYAKDMQEANEKLQSILTSEEK